VPELPEVETVRRGLAPVLVGARLSRVEARRADLRFPFPERFVERLTGARVARLERRAKYLLAVLETGETLVCHLGMSGRFIILDGRNHDQPGAYYYAAPPDPAHTHVVIETQAGVRIDYNDPRRFGYMDLIATDAVMEHPFFKGLGPEPLSEAFNPAQLHAKLHGRTQAIKAALLDQRIVAGLGNIYVCEALFRARVAPGRKAGGLSRARVESLVDAAKQVLAEAIEAGGSSLRDFSAADGALGYFQHRFQVYDREGQACPRAGCPGTINRRTQAGRSTFYCATCQR
jgi:formamidopyrimidine-DNA glycosylase